MHTKRMCSCPRRPRRRRLETEAICWLLLVGTREDFRCIFFTRQEQDEQSKKKSMKTFIWESFVRSVGPCVS